MIISGKIYLFAAVSPSLIYGSILYTALISDSFFHLLVQRFMDFLPCYFYQIERCNIYQCCLDRVFGKAGAEFPHEAFYIFLCVHIDKIYNDYAGEVSEADLPGRLSGSLQIDLQDPFFVLPFSGNALS